MGECIVEGLSGTEIVAGTYTGDGASSRIINLGFTPKWVLVLCNGVTTDACANSSYYVHEGGLAVTGTPARDGIVEIVAGGFRVVETTYASYTNMRYSNTKDTSYSYIAGK